MLQMEFRKAASTQNTTSNIEAVFDANGTVYTVMTYFTGNTLDQTTNDDLSTFLERLRAIAQVLEKYHKAGYLHLDIKPQNIFTIPETAKYVILFDFDSLVFENEVNNGIPLSYTEGFAAPEQRMPNRRSQICKATDLYAIGEILFHRLMDRHSTALEHTGFCDFVSSFDLQKSIFKNVKCTTLDALSEILNNTLCSNPKSRYQTAAELIDAIDAVISKPYLIQNLPDKVAFFPGRDDELTAIDQLLKENGYVFVTGLGGIGKSELCKQYAHAHKEEYDAVVFAICDSSLRTMVLDDKNIRMGNFEGRFLGDSDDTYLERKLGALTDACNERILLIIDNLNSMQDPLLPNFQALNCKKLITTRCKTDANVTSYLVGPIENAREIFDYYYQYSLSDEDDKAVDRILAMYDNHTVLVELVAKQMYCSDLFPSEMLKLLVDGGIKNSGTETVEQFKDNGITEFSLHQHILGLFNIANLSTDQVSILVNLSLLPPSGIERRLFKEWCRLSVSEDINALIRSGWIQENKHSRSISLHPVIADVMHDKLVENCLLCKDLLESILAVVDQQNNGSKDDFLSYLLLRDMALYVCSQLCRLEYVMPLGIQYLAIILDEFAKESDPVRLLPYAKRAIELQEQLRSEPNVLTADLYVIYAHILHEGGLDDVAVDHLMHAQKLLHHLDDQDSQVIGVQLQLGKLLCYMGKSESAEEILRINVKRALEIPDFSPSTLAAVYSCLGDMYMSKGDYAEAKIWHWRRLGERLNDKPDSSVATAYMALAVACAYTEEFEEAEYYLTLAEKVFENLFGRECSKIADIYETRAEIYLALNDYAQAEKCFLDSLLLKEKLFGEAHPKTETNIYALSEIYRRMNQHTKAVEYLVRALSVSLKNNYPDRVLPSEWLADIADQLLIREIPLNELAYGHIVVSDEGTFTYIP